jgi:hypothetical protein
MEPEVIGFGQEDSDDIHLSGLQLVDFSHLDICHRVISPDREKHMCILPIDEVDGIWSSCECPYHSNQRHSAVQCVSDNPLHPQPYLKDPVVAVLSLRCLQFECRYDRNRTLTFWQDWCLRILRNRCVYNLLYGILTRCADVNNDEGTSDDRELLAELHKESRALFVYYLGFKFLMNKNFDAYQDSLDDSGIVYSFVKRTEYFMNKFISKKGEFDLHGLRAILLSMYDALIALESAILNDNEDLLMNISYSDVWVCFL